MSEAIKVMMNEVFKLRAQAQATYGPEQQLSTVRVLHQALVHELQGHADAEPQGVAVTPPEWLEICLAGVAHFYDSTSAARNHPEFPKQLSATVSDTLHEVRRPIQMPMISTTPELLRKTREIPITEFNKLLCLLGKAGDVRLRALVDKFQADVRNRGRQINPTLVGAFTFVDQNVVLLKRLHRLFKFWWKRHFGDWVWHKEGKEVSVILKEDTSIDKLLYAIDKVVQLELNVKHGLFFAEEVYAKDNKELSAEYNQIVKTWLKEIALPRLKLEEAIKAI